MKGRKRLSLILALVTVVVCNLFGILGGQKIRAEDYEVKLAAAEHMTACMERVKQYKRELGISLSTDDWHRTGMIGEAWTPITTTAGALEAKRTCANGDMAALVVQLLKEAGVRSGDTVGAGFSGSFPALNLAVLSACQAMDVDVVYIASVGASTYGANQPELTFPDMVYRLAKDGLIDRHPAANTLGGYMDCGLDMDEALRENIAARLETYPTPLVREEDFYANIQMRMDMYEQLGPINCFVGVGGNMTTSGRNEVELGWGVVKPAPARRINEGSGLVERYSAQGIPVIHLLNVKRLTADYGLPYDPEVLSAPGTSAVYLEHKYPILPGAAGTVGVTVLLWWGFHKREEKK